MGSPALMNINTEDFNAMRSMLSEIEMKIMQVDPVKQIQFYAPIKTMIFEAWQDVCNNDDSFLFPKNNPA